jgi:hypothetical protein
MKLVRILLLVGAGLVLALLFAHRHKFVRPPYCEPVTSDVRGN